MWLWNFRDDKDLIPSIYLDMIEILKTVNEKNS